jgi:cobalt-zinc-cadmium efflux system outer membrane protein
MRALATAAAALALLATGEVRAADVSITYAQALDRAAHVAPDIAVARTGEAIARAGIGIARTLPNPSLTAGSSTQTARLSVGVSVPLLILGQRGAAADAGRAELETARVETEIAAVDVRAGVAHAFVALWRAQETAAERARAAAISRRLEEAVTGRVDLGAAASVDQLRAHAELLRAAADAEQATQLVAAAGSDLSRWLGLDDDVEPRALGEPAIPAEVPLLAELRARVDESPAVRRERADAAAAEARANRERAFVRPALTVDLGVDAWDFSLCPGVGTCDNPPINYRGALTFEVPLLNQRGSYIDREFASAAAARSREIAQRARLGSALTAAYRTFEAWTASMRALREGVVPAADAAAAATEDSYALGRATLVMVLDAERAGIDARLALLEAHAQRADAWIEVEHAMGIP